MPSVLAPLPRGPVVPLHAPPTFAIVIRAYQAAETLGVAVTSALRQAHPATEIIVVDDGSTDDLDEAVSLFRNQVTLIRKAHGGGASALNAAATAASADFIVILDADDAYHPRRLQVLAELATVRPDLDLLTTDARFIVDGEEVGRFSDYNPFPVEEQRSAILESCFVGGWPAIRRSRLSTVGGFDERLRTGSDWDCWLRLILDGALAGFVDEPYYDYHLHPGGVTASRRSTLFDRVRLLEKAQHEPSLSQQEQATLRRSLRNHHTHAFRTEIQAALAGQSSRLALLRHVLGRDLAPRVRIEAAVAAASRPLGRRLVPIEQAPDERFRARG